MSVKSDRFAFVSLLAIALTLCANPVQAQFPQPDADGDYRRVNHHHWEVVDPDPNGLNCRMPDGCTYDDIMGYSCPGFTGDYLDYPIRGTLQVGQRFRGFFSNVGGTFQDNRGLPWVFVGENYDGNTRGCFVRANSNFVKPISLAVLSNLKQDTALPMTITFVEEMAGITVPDDNTTRSAYGGDLRLYDVHIAKMFEVTHYFCQQERRGEIWWMYRAGGGSINMGRFRISCTQANTIANRFGLGKTETTTIRYSAEEGYRRVETFEIPILNLYGPNIPRWLDFTADFSPI
jgi:serine/threonine-protein kinase